MKDLTNQLFSKLGITQSILEKEINKMPPELFRFKVFEDEPLHLTFKIADHISQNYFEIKKVIFNNPATIVYWADGTKTVVKCGEDDIFDEEKALGNSGHYYETFKKWLPEEEGIGIDILQRLTEIFKETKDFNGKKTSRYDWLKKYHPEMVNKGCFGGCFGCPGDYFEELPTNIGDKCAMKNCCEECWKTNYVTEEQNDD